MVAQKVATAVFLKSDVFKKPKKSPYDWATLKRKFETKIFQKSSNLVTLVVTSKF